MSPRPFNRIMLDMGVGTNRKIRRLSVQERWTFVAGILPLAAQSPIRGALLVATSIKVTPQDIAEQAGVTAAVATKTLAHMRTLGMLEVDDDLGFEWVHDFDDWQAEPRQDPTAAIRQKRYRERQKKTLRNTVTSDVTDHVSHGGEVEVEEKTPPTPQGAVTVETGKIDEAKERLAGQADTIPEDLPAVLHQAARDVQQRLLRLHKIKPRSLRPPLAAVGRVLLSLPDRDHVAVADDVEHYWTFGPGQNRSMRDLVATYRNRLTTAPVITPGASRNGSARPAGFDAVLAAAERREREEAQRLAGRIG